MLMESKGVSCHCKSKPNPNFLCDYNNICFKL